MRVIATRHEKSVRITRRMGQVWTRPPYRPLVIAHSGRTAAQLMPRKPSSAYRTRKTAAHSIATKLSTIGYSGEIGERQKRHLPSRRSHPKIGKFSRHVSLVSQDVQRLGGVTTPRPRGMRYTSTFTSDPMHAPKASTKRIFVSSVKNIRTW